MSGALLLLAAQLRRDAWQVLVWAAGIAVLYWSQAVSVDRLYDPADLERAARSMGANPAVVAMTGPPRALDTIGGQVSWQAAAYGAVLAGLMSMFLVGRHTRAAEQDGRDELVRAAPVGRFASVGAAVLETAVANLVVGVAVALSLVAYPLAVADSVALGVGVTLAGWCFAGVALLAVQLTASVRTAYGLTGAAIAAAYGLRAAGDVSAAALSWLSPIGWYQAMHAFSGLRWWPALLLVAGTALTVAAACAVLVRRDHGAGVVAVRPGPRRARPSLRGGLGLAWRLQRSAVGWWGLGMLVAGLAYGSMTDDVADLVGSSDATRELFAGGSGADLTAGFLATSMLMIAIIAAGFTISSALRPHAEEGRHRVDPLLGSGLTRRRWWGGQVAVTLGGTVVVLLLAGTGLAVAAAAVAPDAVDVPRLVAAQLAFAAPASVLAGVTWLLHGAVPRLVHLVWLVLAVAALVAFLGDLMDLPGWIRALSPFDHLARWPLEPFRAGPVLATAALGAALSVMGWTRLAARDLG